MREKRLTEISRPDSCIPIQERSIVSSSPQSVDVSLQPAGDVVTRPVTAETSIARDGAK